MHKVYSSNTNIIICMYGIFNASKRLCSFYDPAVLLEASLDSFWVVMFLTLPNVLKIPGMHPETLLHENGDNH